MPFRQLLKPRISLRILVGSLPFEPPFFFVDGIRPSLYKHCNMAHADAESQETFCIDAERNVNEIERSSVMVKAKMNLPSVLVILEHD